MPDMSGLFYETLVFAVIIIALLLYRWRLKK